MKPSHWLTMPIKLMRQERSANSRLMLDVISKRKTLQLGRLHVSQHVKKG